MWLECIGVVSGWCCKEVCIIIDMVIYQRNILVNFFLEIFTIVYFSKVIIIIYTVLKASSHCTSNSVTLHTSRHQTRLDPVSSPEIRNHHENFPGKMHLSRIKGTPCHIL